VTADDLTEANEALEDARRDLAAAREACREAQGALAQVRMWPYLGASLSGTSLEPF